MALKHVTSGLLTRESFSDLSNWASDGIWSSVADPTLVIFDPSPTVILTPGSPGSSDYDGSREGTLYQEGGTWYLLYDGGDDTHGWLQQMASSTDRGATWTRLGSINPPGYSNGSGGSVAAAATGWIEKRSGTYYLHRVIGGSLGTSSVGTGLPLGPYTGDIWSASSLTGTWSFVRTVPLVPASWGAVSRLPGSVYYDGTTYHLFTQGDPGGPAGYEVGRATAASPGGPYTLGASADIATATFGDSRQPENPKVFYHSVLGRYAILTNLIGPAGTSTDQNALILSTSLTNWSGATIRRIQHVSPLDGTNSIGVMTHWTGPDGALIVEADGSMPVAFDGLGTGLSPGYHLHRTIRGGVLEPAASCARYTSGDTTARRIVRSQTNGDFVAEWSVELRSMDATSGLLSFEFRRQDSSNYYRLVLTPSSGLRLDKVVAGTPTTLQSASSPTETGGTNLVHRIRLIASGTTIQAWLNGEQHINTTNSTYSSGVSIAFQSTKLDGDLRLFSLRTAQTVTIAGVKSGDVVNLRGAGGLLITSGTASGSSIVLTAPHYPAVSFDVNSTSYVPQNLIWGGDIYSVNASPVRLPFG